MDLRKRSVGGTYLGLCPMVRFGIDVEPLGSITGQLVINIHIDLYI
jgi:hypothetical protein